MLLSKIEKAVYYNLQHAQVVSLVQNPSDDIERDGYWEHSFIVTWSLPVEGSEPSPDDNGYTYGTHRVHINSLGESACYDGRYRMSYLKALSSMLERAQIGANLVTDKDSGLALWFTPDAISQHFADGDKDDPIVQWIAKATDEQLYAVSEGCIGMDSLYKEFHYLLETEVQWQIDHPNGEETK